MLTLLPLIHVSRVLLRKYIYERTAPATCTYKNGVNLRGLFLYTVLIAQLTGSRCTVGRAKRSPHLYLSQTQTPARTMVARNGLETATAPMPKPGLLPLKRGSVMYSPARAAITYSHPYYTPRTVHGPCRLYHVVDNVVVITNMFFGF